MRSFLSDLVRVCRTARSARPARRSPHRVSLQAELLEDRLVPTTAILTGSILAINIPQNHGIALRSDGASKAQMQVFDNGTLLKFNQPLNISSITAVNITVAGGDNVDIDDNNGMPFAPNTLVKLQGGGNNEFSLEGSRSINSDELYLVAATSIASTILALDNLTFQLSSAITSVHDYLQISGQLAIATSGTVVTANSGGFAPVGDAAQTITGLGAGGGGTFTYANKGKILLNEFGANVSVTVNQPTPDSGESLFTVKMFGTGDRLVTIGATPSNVLTNVEDDTSVSPANFTTVQLVGDAGPVEIEGNSTTFAVLGSTQSLHASVVVRNVGTLLLASELVSTPQKVRVTEFTITGTGLFGNNGVAVSYYQVGRLHLSTGAGLAVYTVAGAYTSSRFTTPIEIFDNSTQFIPLLSLTSQTGLDIELVNFTHQKVALYFIFANAQVTSSSPGNGVQVIDVAFGDGPTNVLTLVGFNS